MPLSNGVELIEKVRSTGMECEFIVLSGFGEFEFAKKAIEYDVVNYLLKPVSNEELIDAVVKAIERIKARRRNESASSLFSRDNEDMKRRIIRTLVRNDYQDIATVKNEIACQGYELIASGYFLIGVLDDCSVENAQELYVFESLLADALQESGIRFLSGIYHEKISFIVEQTDLMRLDSILYKVFETFSEQSRYTVSVGISTAFSSHEEIQRTYDEAKSVAESGLLRFTNSVQYFNASSKKYSANLLRALDIIHKEYSKDIGVAYVSEKLNVSESYLMHMFKNELGQTFNNILVFNRIREAKILLRTGKYRVNEIAYRVGFNDEKYFTYVFKRKVGMTPSEFAKKEEKI